MGCYMSTPDNRVYVTEGKGKNFRYATASCQGWRREQEDAEDCLPYFDDNASLFVLCDGHGGAEVAKYTVEHLPDFIKNHPLYKEGKYEEALEKAFIDFDCLLRTDEVMLELQKLAFDGDQNEQDKEGKTMDLKEKEENQEKITEEECKPSCSSSAGPSNNGATSVVEDVDTDTLRKEAQVPLRQLLEQYSAGAEGIDPSKRNSLLAKYNSSPVVRSRPDDEDENGDTSGPSSSGASNSLEGQPGTSSGTQEGETPPLTGEDIKQSLIQQVIKHYFNSDDSSDSDGSEFDAEDSSNEDDGDDEDDDDEKNDNETKKLRRKKHRRPVDQSSSSSSSGSDDDDDDDDDDEEEDDEDEEEDQEEDDDDEVDDEGKYFSAYDFLTGGKSQQDEIRKTHTAGWDSGCTVVVALVKDEKLYVASAGDSRCIMILKNGDCKPMSFDHKPENVGERRRITKAGGRIIEGRVNGGLNLSRAFGDFTYKNIELDPKEQMITPCPDVKVADIDPETIEYIFLACDGIWNSMKNQQAAKFIRRTAECSKENLVSICVRLFRECIASETDGDGTGCDNMTCILAKFGDTSIEDSATSDLKTESVESETQTTTSNKRSTNEETTSDLPTKRRCIRL